MYCFNTEKKELLGRPAGRPPPIPPPLKNYAVLSYLGENGDVAKLFHKNTISLCNNNARKQHKCIADHGQNAKMNVSKHPKNIISFNGVRNHRKN